ncbi:hypothetical protein SAMN04488032_103289 [Pacificibacter marinus]|uniref:HTH-like domain-containing protein n=1 Tax=Pacificibacter marinus TaxID=658057 RepID=A0A1Y5TN73_9RHOB|nr:hypothetical protein SAMN04488032_103289 [Pacificibacter marinus]SLN67930.1 hypothetical protein PAM7971_03604 [Pacificibacter marinus]
MTEDLKEIGLNVGHRRVGCLMRQNGIAVVRARIREGVTLSWSLSWTVWLAPWLIC